MAFVQAWTNSTPASTQNVTVAPSAGHVLLAWQATDATSTAPTVIPSGFETTPLVDATSTTDGSRLTVWIKKNTTGSETTVTMSDNSSNQMIAGVAEFSGIDTTTPLDVAAVPFNTSSSVTTGSASITPVTNGCDLAIVHLPDGASGDRTVSYSTTSGTTSAWTVRVDQTDGGFFNVALGSATQTTAGALTAQASQSISGGLVMVLVALRPAGPSLSAQPTDQTVNDGATATFSVTATGGTAPYTYQWQDNSSGSFANIGGATSSSYSPTASFSIQGRQYKCIVTDSGSLSVTSNTATLRVAFKLSGTGPRSFSQLGHPFGAGSIEAFLRGTNSTSGVSGSSSTTNANDISSASGTTTIVGTSSRTNNNDTSTASGTTTIVGSLAKTNNNDTSTASGSPVVNGTLSRTNANDTLAASGTIGTAVSGSLAQTNNNDTSTASGNVTILGTLAKTNNNDTSTGSGSPIIVGTLARTNNNDTSSASGTTTIQGSSSTTNANDTLAASGTVTTGSVSGSSNTTNNNDTGSASGTITVQGTLGRTNNNDTLAASGTAGNPVAGNTTKLPMTGVGT